MGYARLRVKPKKSLAHFQAKHNTMMKFVNDVLIGFRSCFSRKAAFEWFVVIVIGLLVRTDHLGVTSIIRGLLLSVDYVCLIGFFRSSAWTLPSLTAKWCETVKQHAPLVKCGDAVIIVGDGVKQSKEGRRMPGVKRHHQESDNSGKASYIWGHLFGGVGILAEKAGKCFCIPLALILHDGVKTIFGWGKTEERQCSHVVETIKLALKTAVHFGKSILLLDRLYLTVPALRTLDSLNAGDQIMHLVTKAKSNCVVYHVPQNTPGKRGRPRKRGTSLKVFDLFKAAAEQFNTVSMLLYGKPEEVRYHCVDLLWGKGLYKLLRFVLVEYGSTQTVLASTDLTLNPLDIIQLYGKRFGIEVMFREMKQVVCAFGYRFWSKHMPKLKRFSKKTAPDPVDQITDPKARKRITLAIKAIEGFMFCAVVATGLLQMASLKFSGTHELANLRYLRTNRKSIVSEATIADFIRKNFICLMQRNADLPITQIISAKQIAVVDAADLDDAA